MGRLKLKPTRARLSKRVFKSEHGNADKLIASDKGKYLGSCNITACQRPNSAIWYNHSTQKYYCEPCALMLNRANQHDEYVVKTLGHDLCTKGKYDARKT